MFLQAQAAIARFFDPSQSGLLRRLTGKKKRLSFPTLFRTRAEHSDVMKSPAGKKKQGRLVVCALQTYSRVGGMQNFNRRVIRKLAERTAERDETPPLVLLRGDGSAAMPQLPKVDLVPLDGLLGFVGRSVWAGFTEADVFIVCHVNLLPIGALVRVLRPKVKVLLFVHGDEVWNQSFRYMRWYEPHLARLLTRVASVSRFTAEIMAREYQIPEAKFRLLPNAVDPATPVIRARRDNTILTVTRLGDGDREKNVDKMIRAVAHLRERRPDIRYEIVGDGVLRRELESLAKDLGVADIVTFCGRVDDAELRAAYERAAVFAMPSSKEGFGIVYLEAWQFGLPVICSSQGASKEIIDDGVDGFVVDPEDISMIADRLELLLSRNGLARKMGELGRRKVEEKYLDPAFRKNLDTIIDELRDAS